MKFVLPLILVLVILTPNLGAQVLFFDQFTNTSNWTFINSGTNSWEVSDGNDSLVANGNGTLYISCDTCSGIPKYNRNSLTQSAVARKTTPVVVPSTNYEVKFLFNNWAQSSDLLYFEYSYDNVNWVSMPSLPVTYGWGQKSFRFDSDFSGFTPGSSVYFRFRFNVAASADANYLSCGIDNFTVETTEFDVINVNQTLFVSSGSNIYFKNADYYVTGDPDAKTFNQGEILFHGESDFINNGEHVTSGSGNIVFHGSSYQAYKSSNDSIANLLIDKSFAKETVFLDSNLVVTGNLNCNKGIIVPSKRRYYLDLATSSTPVASDSAYVSGAVRYRLSSTNRLYPVGSGGVYRPLEMDATTGNFRVSYHRSSLTPSFDSEELDSVSTSGHWEVRHLTGSYPNSVKLYFGDGGGKSDHVYNVDSTRVAISENSGGEFKNYDYTTHSGTASNGTVTTNQIVHFPTTYYRVGYAKDGRIGLKAMLQGALSDKETIWEDNFNTSDWTTSSGTTMIFKTDANSFNLQNVNNLTKNFKGLAFVNLLNQKNSWAGALGGTGYATMNANVPYAFSGSESYTLEFEWYADGNAYNNFQLEYSINGGGSWNPHGSTFYQSGGKWATYSVQLDPSNFPGFNPGSTPIRFRFRGDWGLLSLLITDSNNSAPLISNLRIKKDVTSPVEMHTYLKQSYILDSLTYTNSDYSMENPPSSAVDLIDIELRNSNTSVYTVVDSAKVWLLADGSVRDAKGNNFIKFYHVNSGSYYMVIKHRNHLPIMSNNTVTFSSLTETTVINMTDLANIMDGTAWQYSTGKYAMYMGNVTEDFPNGDYFETNSSDFFVVSLMNDSSPDRGFYREDVNLDGFVNAEDFDKVQIGNNNLYFSTVPQN